MNRRRVRDRLHAGGALRSGGPPLPGEASVGGGTGPCPVVGDYGRTRPG